MKGPPRAPWPFRGRCCGVLAAALSVMMVGCGAGQRPGVPGGPAAGQVVLDTAEIAELIPRRHQDRREWGEAISNALAANTLPADKSSVCAIIAVLAQESGFAVDPIVPGMANIAAARIDRYKARL